MSELKVLADLKQGLREKAFSMLSVSGLDEHELHKLKNEDIKDLVLAGQYYALMELHRDFDKVFDTINGRPDNTVCGFQNGIFQRYREIQSRQHFTGSTGWNQVEGKSREIILDYGRMIEMISLADDVTKVIALVSSKEQAV